MVYLMLFVEGVLTFISPCILPLLPLYLTYFGAESSKETARQESSNVLKKATLFVLGFTLVFTSLSLFVNSIGRFVLVHQQIIGWIAGGLIILFGIDQIFGNRFSARLVPIQTGTNRSLMNPFVFGVLFAITWTPCVGVYLASALALSLTAQNYGQSVLMLLTYSLGLGIPFILSALLIDESTRIMDFLKPHLSGLQKLSGILLVLFGIALATGYIYNFITL